jgi:hypothetical protein
MSSAVLDSIVIGPQQLPVRQLIQSLNERLKKSPDDLQAIFTLGRVHYFAFAGATDTIFVAGAGGPIPYPYDGMGPRGRGTSAYRSRVGQPEAISESARIEHLKNAITHLSRVVSMQKGAAATDGRYELCLASAYEQGALYAAKAGVINSVPATERAWLDAAISYYGVAFDESVTRDLGTKFTPMFGLDELVSYEAGRAYQRLIAARGNPSAAEQERLIRVKALIAKAQALPPGPITPIIFAIDRDVALNDLLSSRIVAFDLDGTGRRQQYRWVQPDTGILVWDPQHTGRITSGRQLFGSVTWWMFWDDGYQALATLDDDRNGWIEGREMAALGVWFDRNQNGRSDPAEVQPVSETAITGVAAFATSTEANAMVNRRGLRLADGRVLPTYDWVTRPVRDTTR